MLRIFPFHRLGSFQKFFFLLLIFSLTVSGKSFAALFEDKEKAALKAELEKASRELEVIRTDRDNILKQAKIFLADKESLEAEIKKLKGEDSQVGVELEAFKKENEILKSEIETLKKETAEEQEDRFKEKEDLEQRIADLEAQAASLAAVTSDYPPAKIQQLVEDHNRLDVENLNLAKQILEYEKQIEDWKRQLKPFELDREELYRVRTENQELKKRFKYINELEERQKQLLQENAEYREKLEVMKGKFKESVPGLARVSRISQKMMRENADMHYNLGTIFLNNKQHREAIREYEQVLELRPNDPDTHYNLGVLYDDYLKDREKALYHYQKYLAVSPKAPDAKRVESYILALELEQKIR